MSILNLNTPQGHGPAGKKKTKILMGVGLLAAVLGLGSTFAANISINNDNQSEFGQGVTQTVYCGADNPTKITVTPISTFVNSTNVPGSDAVADTWTPATGSRGSFEDVSDDSSSQYRSYARYQNPSDGSYEDNKAGYWLRSRNSTSSSDIYKGSSTSSAPIGFPVFVPQVRERGTSGDYGYYPYSSWVDGFFSGGRDAVPASSTPAKFELGGVKLSDIPGECVGVDFIVSAYGSGSTPLELSDDLNVTEVAVNYAADGTPGFSFDRTTPGATSGYLNKVAVTMDEGYIKVMFTPEAGRLLTSAVTKVIVETQENIIGN
jgi:hypothetical protein